MFLQGSGATTLAISSGNTQTIAGDDAIAGDGTLIKDGDGTLVIAGLDFHFKGDATVAGGLLQVDGAIGKATTTVETGATLGGNGKVGITEVDSGATLSPGASAGLLHTHDLTFGAASNFVVEIGGTTAGIGGYDRVVVKGTVDLDGAILDASLIDGFKPSFGDTFNIIDNDGHDAVIRHLPRALPRARSSSSTTARLHHLLPRRRRQRRGGADRHSDTIIGTSGADVVDANHTVAGQPLPTDGADLIKGKGGADTSPALAATIRFSAARAATRSTAMPAATPSTAARATTFLPAAPRTTGSTSRRRSGRIMSTPSPTSAAATPSSSPSPCLRGSERRGNWRMPCSPPASSTPASTPAQARRADHLQSAERRSLL